MREIRDLRAESQPEFAAAINATARRFQFDLSLTFNDVSKRETGIKGLDVPDLVCIAYLDPKKRGWFWLAYGTDVTIGRDAWAIIEGRRRVSGGD